MNKIIQQEMEILWSDYDEYSVNQKLEAFERLKAASSRSDLSQLLDLLKSEQNDFWVRELLAEPISEYGGSNCLPELFDGLKLNELEGHDNDTFLHFLTEIAYSGPMECKSTLQNLIARKNYEHKTRAEWLIEFCE